MNFGAIIIQNVNHSKEADSSYKNTIQKIFNSLSDTFTSQTTLQNIQNAWTLSQMAESSTNSGTAYLLQKGFELLPEAVTPEYYLEEYKYIQTTTVQDFIDILNTFPSKANLRVYSSEGKE